MGKAYWILRPRESRSEPKTIGNVLDELEEEE